MTYGGHDFAHYSVEDSARVKAGTGCRRADPGRRHLFTCDMDIFGEVRAVVRLGDRSDLARVLGDFDSARVEAGGGDDVVRGRPGGRHAARRARDGRPVRRRRGGQAVRGSAAGGAWTGRRTVSCGGAGSDLLAGSAGANLIDGGPGVDKVDAGRGRDIIQARDGAIEQVHCGAGEDSAITDGIDYPLACEHHEPYSKSSPVPVELSTKAGSPQRLRSHRAAARRIRPPAAGRFSSNWTAGR